MSCPSCSGEIARHPETYPPAPRSQVTLTCKKCTRVARYIAGPAEQMAS